MTINKLSQSRERSSMIKLFYDSVVLESCSITMNKLSHSWENAFMSKLGKCFHV